MVQRKSLDIEKLAEQRMAAGISDPAEEELYFKGDLVDSDYSQEFKESLLQELERSVTRRGPASQQDYQSLLACTNEVVRLALPLMVKTYQGKPCIRVQRSGLAWGLEDIKEHTERYSNLFGESRSRRGGRSTGHAPARPVGVPIAAAAARGDLGLLRPRRPTPEHQDLTRTGR